MFNAMSYAPGFDTYGTLQLTESDNSPAIIEPLSLAEMKNYLRVDAAVTDDDLLIGTLISAAREQAEIMQGRVLVQKQFDLTYDYWPAYAIELASPFVSVDSVTYRDSDGNTTELVADVDYTVDRYKQPAIIQPPSNASWPSFNPWPSSAIMIRFTAGYQPNSPFWNSSGARLKAGMMLLISAWYSNRLPFVTGLTAVNEYPYAVTACLSHGSLKRPR